MPLYNKKDKEMVKVINIDTKTRTIRVENAADGDIKTWRTTESGAHFPIKKGESTKEALDKFVEKKRGTGIDEKVPRNLPPELKKKEQESAKAREKLQKDLRKDVFGPSEKETSDTKGTMKESATDWYAKKFKSDKKMAPKNGVTFEQLYESLKKGENIYDKMGVDDSIVRERVMSEMADRLGVEYDHVYDLWLHGGEKGSEPRKKKQEESIAFMDKLLKEHTDLDPELRKAIVSARQRAKKDIK
jgi:hypothetical protein